MNKSLRDRLGKYMNGFYGDELSFKLTDAELSDIESKLTARFRAERDAYYNRCHDLEEKIAESRTKIEQLRSKVAAADVMRNEIKRQFCSSQAGVDWNELDRVADAYDAAPVAASEPDAPAVISDATVRAAWANLAVDRPGLTLGEVRDVLEKRLGEPVNESDDDTQDPRKQDRPHRERIDDLVTRADASNDRLDIHMRQIADLDKRVKNVSDMHNSLAEMVHAAALEGKRLDDLDSRFADHMEKIQFVLDIVHRNQGETLEKIQRVETSIEELRPTALEGTDDPEDDDEIERVAIAIYVASGAHVTNASAETWTDYHPIQQDDYRRLAKAALKAQGRQPVTVKVTDAMVDAYAEASRANGGFVNWHDAIRAGITAAIAARDGGEG